MPHSYIVPWLLDENRRYTSITGCNGNVIMRMVLPFIRWANVVGVSDYTMYHRVMPLKYVPDLRKRIGSIQMLMLPHKTYLFMEANLCLKHVTPKF